MKSFFLFLFAAFLFINCQQESSNQVASASVKNPVMNLTYPETKTVEQKDDYFGTEIADPYRWLEIDTAADVGEWVKAQNEVTFDYLSKIPLSEFKTYS